MESEFTKRDMSPVIIAAVDLLKKVDGVNHIKIHGDLMHEVDGELGVELMISTGPPLDIGFFQHRLSLADAEKVVEYPVGTFFAVNYILTMTKKNSKTLFRDDLKKEE